MADEKTQAAQQAKHAAQSAASAAAMKKKRKKWYPVIAPKMFENMMLGETLLDESSQLMGKILKMSMMNISGDPKRQNINIGFKVTKVQEGKGLAEITSFEVQANSLRRLMRRDRRKTEDSFVCKTVDEKYVLVKPIIITQGAASHAKLTDIKKHTRQLLKEIIHQNSFETLIEDLLDYKPQKYLKDLLSKIYPIRTVEIKTFELTKTTKETVNEILTKMTVKPKEEADEEEEHPQENEDKPQEAVVDQMQEIEEEQQAKKRKNNEEENPLSEGV